MEKTLTKAAIARIKSLKDKKERDRESLFVAEGLKCVSDLLDGGMEAEELYVTDEKLNEISGCRATLVTKAQMERMTHFKSASTVLALIRKHPETSLPDTWRNDLVVALDDVQDPGNLGTIIRACDWFGIRDIVCSPASADAYNAKTVQATMGALCRVRVHYAPLADFLGEVSKGGGEIYGTFLNGESIYTAPPARQGVIVMGNEGNGISDEVAALVSRRILIPSYPQGAKTGESLNVGVATAIVCAIFRGAAL